MDQEEIDRKKFAATHLVDVTQEYIDKIKSNDEAITEKKASAKSIVQISSEISKILGKLIQEMRAPGGDPQEKLAKSSEFLISLITSLETTAKSSTEEAMRLEATQQGMRRALEAVREAGTLQVRELERIEALSYESSEDVRRSVGERPEKISVKRNASSLKKSRESEDS